MSKHQLGDFAGGLEDDEAVLADDALCDALSHGVDTSAGEDPLAGLLLGLKADVDAPCPPTPNLDELLPDHSAAPTTTFAAVTKISSERDSVASAAPGGVTTEHTPAEVVDLTSRRTPKHRVGWLGAGLTGAAAATLIIAGGGALIHSAEPGDPLWGLNEAIFSHHAAVVELASTLEEADSRNASGDVQGALQLLEQAKAMAQQMNANQVKKIVTPTTVEVTITPPPTTQTVTETLVPEPTTAPPSTVTITSKVVVTPSAKPSATNLPPGVKPSTQAVPLTAIMPSEEIAPRSSQTVPTVEASAVSEPVTQAVPLTTVVE